MVKILEKTIKHYLPILYFTISIAFYLRTYDSCQIKITLVHIGGTILLTLWLIKLIEEYDFEFFKRNIVIILPVILALCSNLLSHFISPLKYSSGMELIRKVMYFGIALLVMKEFNSEEKIKRLLRWLFFACFLATFYGIIQYLDVRFFPLGQGVPGLDPFIWRGAFGDRLFSTFGNPNFYGDFLVVMAPIVLAMFFKTKSFFLGVLYLMIAFNVYYTYSKGAWIGFVFGFIAFCFFAINFISYFKKENIKKILIGTAVFILIAATPILIKATKARMDSVKFRVYTWMSCWEMINTRPIFGTGIGTFYVTYPAWRRPQIFFIEAKHNTESDHPENEYLEVWYDEGIVGFAIFLWIIVQCLKCGWSNLKIFSQETILQTGTKGKTHKIPEDPRTYYMLGFLSSFCGMLSHNFVCVSLRFVSSGVFLWLLVGLINAFSINNPLPKESDIFENNKNPIPKSVRQIFYVCLIIVSGYLILIFRGFFIGDIHHNIAIFHSKRGEWSDALTNYNIVAKNNFGFIMAHYFMGNVFNDRWILKREFHPEWGDSEKDTPWTEYEPDKKGRVDPERSISKYEDVWSLAPNYVQSHHQAGLVYLKLADMAKARGDMELAKKYWEKAIYRFERYHAIDPIFAQNYYRLAWVYLQMGEPDKAEETYFRHLYTKDALFTPGADEKEWVSAQIGRPATTIPDWCEIHKGIYHSFYREDWGKRRNPEYSETYMNLGNLKFMKNDLKKAEEFYLKSIELNPENIQAMKNLIVIYNRTNRMQEAIQLWQKIRQISPNDPDVQKVFSKPS